MSESGDWEVRPHIKRWMLFAYRHRTCISRWSPIWMVTLISQNIWESHLGRELFAWD
jgi:hypothetical protein